MKKSVGKVKRFIAMLMVGITLFSSVFYSYSIPAQATTIIPVTETVIEALMTLFGYSLGFGKSTKNMSTTLTPEVFSSAIDSSFNGGGIQLGSYGTVDFSDEVAVFDFLKTTYQMTAATLASEAYNKLLSSYDYISYKTSGVSSTKTMNEYLGAVVSKYESEGTSALKEDMQQAFTVIEGGAGDGEDPDDFSDSSWSYIAALMAALYSVDEYENVDWDAVGSVPTLSQFDIYSMTDLGADGKDYFSSLSYDSSGNIIAYVKYTLATGYYIRIKYYGKRLAAYSHNDNSTGVYIYNGGYFVYSEENGTQTQYSTYGYENDIRNYTHWSGASFFDGVVPYFSSQEEAYAYALGESSYENALNYLNSETVTAFYETTPTCTVPEYVVNFMTKTPSISDVTGLAAALTELSPDTAGTPEYIPAVEGVIQDAIDELPDSSTDTGETPEEDVEPEIDPETGNFNYFNILQLILDAIRAIAESVWAFFENPMAAITTGINNLIELVPNCFELVRGWIEPLPGSIYQFFEAPLLAIQEALAGLNPFESWWPRLQPYLDKFLALFQSAVPEPDAMDPDIPSEDEGGNGKHSFDLLSLLNGLWLLIMILIMLLSIFLHLMIFIINIFKIPATTGYLNENMVMGLNYIKTLEITGIGLSVYDFMMGLVYILMVFGVVKVLRHNINHIKIPKSMRGGLFS